MIQIKLLDPQAKAETTPNRVVLHAFTPDREGRTRRVLIPPRSGKFVRTKTMLAEPWPHEPVLTTPQSLIQEFVHACGIFFEEDHEMSIYLVSHWHDAIYIEHHQPIAILSFYDPTLELVNV